MYQTTAFLQHTIKRIEDQHLQTTLDANQFSQNKSSSISPLHLLVVQYSPRFYVAVSALCVVVVVLLPSSMLSCSLPGELLTLRLVRAVASLLLLLCLLCSVSCFVLAPARKERGQMCGVCILWYHQDLYLPLLGASEGKGHNSGQSKEIRLIFRISFAY